MTDNELLEIDRIQKIQSVNEQYELESNAYLSFSGGKDSTVLHYLLDIALPGNKIPRVFINTGIEYNYVVDFVKELAKSDDRIVIVNSGVNIKKMLETEGYPFKSKEHSLKVGEWQKGSRAKFILNYLEMSGKSKFACPKTLLYQYSENFKIKLSDKCCYRLKKDIVNKWEKMNDKTIAMTGMLSEEGGQRANLVNCLITKNGKVVKFHPLLVCSSLWEDWFIQKHNIQLCKLYYPPFNFKRTGCKGCPYSLDLQHQLDVMAELLPSEYRQCENIWKVVYDEYRRINYRLRNQTTIFDFIKPTIRVVELFGGIGACTAALKRIKSIDVEVVDYVEIDKYAVASYNAINGTEFKTQDIREWDKNLTQIDLILHGSPFQDFSLAGKQAGGDEGSGTRSSLLYESIRIISKIKPRFVIWENVKNVLSKTHRHNFDNYLKKMEQLGYANHYQVLNAKDYGIPQNRERVFTVSVLGGGLFDFEFPQKQKLNLRLKDMLEEEVDENYFLSEEQINAIKKSTFTQNKRRIQDKDICDTLCARDWKDPKCVQVGQIYGTEKEPNPQAGRIYDSNYISPTIDSCNGGNRMPKILIKNATKQGYLEAEDGDGVYISNIDKKRGTVQKGMIPTLKTSPDIGVVVLGNYSPSGHNASRIVDKEGIAPTVMENHGTVTAIVEDKPICLNSKGGRNGVEGLQPSRKDRIYSSDGVACTIATNDFYNPNYLINADKCKEILWYRDMYSSDEFNRLIITLKVRKLTPKEYWRLMGFSDENFDKAEKVCSNTQLYKQAGNSIVVDVLEKILINLLKGRI